METIREASDNNNNKLWLSSQKLAFLRGFDNYLSWSQFPHPLLEWMEPIYSSRNSRICLSKCVPFPGVGRGGLILVFQEGKVTGSRLVDA